MKGIVRYIIVLLLICTTIDAVSQVSDGHAPISTTSRAIKGWATNCTLIRGFRRIDEPESGRASFGEDHNAIGPADNIVVSLGDGGMAIISFGHPFKDNPGPDFAVFENSFDGKYLELAFVEVSSDSIRWVRFPSTSDVPTDVQTGPFGTTDPGLIHNFAGKHPAMFGTPFFLEDLSDSTGLDPENVRFIRIIDVIGSVNQLYCSYDSRGIPVNDPWPTPFPQSGFDLDAVALIDISLLSAGSDVTEFVSLFPNPVSDKIIVNLPSVNGDYLKVLDIHGRVRAMFDIAGSYAEFSLGHLNPGIYIAEVVFRDGSPAVFQRFLKL